MKNKFTLLSAPAIIICWCLFCIQGCKDPLVNSSSLLLRSDSLNLAQTTIPVTAITQISAPIASAGTSIGVLGSISDHNFGTTYGSFYAQCQLTSASVNFGYSPTLDSVVLTLAYAGQYGPCTKPVNVVVYELNQDLQDSVNYYTNSSFQVKTPSLGQINNFVPNFTDSVYVPALGISLPASMSVTLSNSFGNKILLADANILSSNAAFLAYVKGLYITTTSAATGNGIAYLNLLSPLSAVNLYYHYAYSADSPANVLGQFSLPLTGISVDHYDNTYMGTPAYAAIHSANPAAEPNLFIEGGGGVDGKITFNLDSLPKKIGINKAEIILAQSTADTQYAVPSLLNLLRIDDAGQGQTIDDAVLSTFGGVLQTDVVDGVSINRYHFNLSVYFQRLVQGIYKNNGLYLTVQNAAYSADRVTIVNSSTNKNYKLSLKVTYTKLL